ncbi:MAG: flagellar biosynthesis protein FlhG [Eubacteriales bacterium]|nr:flagellar biosynthesis protein FlhG [Eubacteriales bacterium]MDN5364732.1 flagellar biosynthesis protein FlhG [Eubacteriales bacterium]
MQDQAYKLRLLAQDLHRQVEEELKARARTARVITVTSGKGGVGKTNFSLNLGIALQKLNKRTILIDADLGMANVDVVLGLVPRYTLYDVIKGEKEIDEIIVEGPDGLKIIPGGSGIQELANLDRERLESIITQIYRLDGEADLIIIDTGAGLSQNVMSFVLAADEVILLTTPEPTAITDAYGLVKNLFRHRPDSKVYLVVNMAESDEEAEMVARKLEIVTQKFLQAQITCLGYILNDPHVARAVKMQVPFIISYPSARASRRIKEVAARLVDVPDYGEEKGLKGFLDRMLAFFGRRQ